MGRQKTGSYARTVKRVQASPPMYCPTPGLGNISPWKARPCVVAPSGCAAAAGKCILRLGRKCDWPGIGKGNTVQIKHQPLAWRPQGPSPPHYTTLATTIRRWGREAVYSSGEGGRVGS